MLNLDQMRSLTRRVPKIVRDACVSAATPEDLVQRWLSPAIMVEDEPVHDNLTVVHFNAGPRLRVTLLLRQDGSIAYKYDKRN